MAIKKRMNPMKDKDPMMLLIAEYARVTGPEFGYDR
jgi:hypothetical protein